MAPSIPSGRSFAQQGQGAVQSLRDRVADSVPRHGPLGMHLDEVKSLKPEVAQVDLMTFRSKITSAGVITQPDQLSVPSGFNAELVGIRGFMQKPGTDPELLAVTRFNIRDMSRTGNLFSNPIEMGYVIGTDGGGGSTLMWERGIYVFDSGGRIKVTMEVDSDGTIGYSNTASEDKFWGVGLILNLYAV